MDKNDLKNIVDSGKVDFSTPTLEQVENPVLSVPENTGQGFPGPTKSDSLIDSLSAAGIKADMRKAELERKLAAMKAAKDAIREELSHLSAYERIERWDEQITSMTTALEEKKVALALLVEKTGYSPKETRR